MPVVYSQSEKVVEFDVLPVKARNEVTEPSAFVIRTEEEWRKFLAETVGHAGARPRVDFRRDTVVAIFAGQRPSNGYSVRVEAVTQKGNRVTVRHHVIAPPQDALVTQALTFPYAVIRIAARPDVIEFQPTIPMPSKSRE